MKDDVEYILRRIKKSGNQCDGCIQGLPLGTGTATGLHIHAATGKPFMACTAYRYKTLTT